MILLKAHFTICLLWLAGVSDIPVMHLLLVAVKRAREELDEKMKRQKVKVKKLKTMYEQQVALEKGNHRSLLLLPYLLINHTQTHDRTPYRQSVG